MHEKYMKYKSFHNRINFLMALNKLSTSLYFEETTEVEGSEMPKFEIKLASLYVKSGYFSPTDALREAIKKLVIKFFKTDEIHYNNTGTIFWISDMGSSVIFADKLFK